MRSREAYDGLPTLRTGKLSVVRRSDFPTEIMWQGTWLAALWSFQNGGPSVARLEISATK